MVFPHSLMKTEFKVLRHPNGWNGMGWEGVGREETGRDGTGQDTTG